MFTPTSAATRHIEQVNTLKANDVMIIFFFISSNSWSLTNLIDFLKYLFAAEPILVMTYNCTAHHHSVFSRGNLDSRVPDVLIRGDLNSVVC